MPRGKPTSDFTKGQVVALKQDGKSIREISRSLKLPKSTVLDIWKKSGNKQRSGRPSLTTSRPNRALVHMSLQDRFLTAPQLQLAWKDTCDVSATVKSINGRIARRKPL